MIYEFRGIRNRLILSLYINTSELQWQMLISDILEINIPQLSNLG